MTYRTIYIAVTVNFTTFVGYKRLTRGVYKVIKFQSS